MNAINKGSIIKALLGLFRKLAQDHVEMPVLNPHPKAPASTAASSVPACSLSQDERRTAGLLYWESWNCGLLIPCCWP